MNVRSSIPVTRERGLMGETINALQRDIDRLFGDFAYAWPTLTGAWPVLGRSVPALTPRMDVVETDNTLEITTELPGLEEKDVHVDVADNVLTITGEKKAEKEQKDTNYRMFERNYGSFARAVELPAGTNPESINATLSNGVLKVVVPRAAPARVKTVEVKAAA
jgi:HSP20 family protein